MDGPTTDGMHQSLNQTKIVSKAHHEEGVTICDFNIPILNSCLHCITNFQSLNEFEYLRLEKSQILVKLWF